MRTLWLILLTAVSYYVAGRLGLLLAIPPGYATAVWPAAGLALAAILLGGYRLWPGILLGSFCVNVGVSFDASSLNTIARSVVIAGAIGSGAALQALAGGWLIRRFAGYSNILTEEYGALRMLCLGGPVACVVNASVSVTTLWLAGLIPGTNYLFSWWTWWVGDSIGVLIFTTLVLVWSLRPYAKWKRQQIMVSLPMALMFMAVVGLFVIVSDREETRIQGGFEKSADQFNHELGKDIDVYLNTLSAIVGMYEGSDKVESSEFNLFAGRLLSHQGFEQAVSWTAYLKHANRGAFEAAMRTSLRSDFRISEIGPGDQRVAAKDRAEYFPVVYNFPYERNRGAIGYDIGSESVRRAAIERALKDNSVAATGPIQLVQFETEATGVLLVAPTYRGGQSDGELLGLATVVIRIVDLVKSPLAHLSNTGIQVYISDDTSPAHLAYLYSSTGNAVSKKNDVGGLRYSTTIDVARHAWRVDFYIPPAYLIAHSSWQAWSLLAAGLFMTALLGVFVMSVAGQTVRTEAVVTTRTHELEMANEALRSNEQAMALNAKQLAEKNEELGRFAYVVSHDLQAPLRGITGFAGLLGKCYRDQLDDEGREFLQFIVDGAAQMRRMIADILELSRVGTGKIDTQPTDIGALVDEVCSILRMDIEQAGAKVEHDALPVVSVDESQIRQLFQNMIGNAIKFRPADRTPVIRISSRQAVDGWHFQVADNGIGIPKEKQDRLFSLFVRLHTEDQFPGTGLGLAICKRIVERHGGRIWLESVPDKGTTFHFILAAAA
jgi:signal transduction histidine kinase/integral membrane sensor domain MASE1